MNNKQSQTSGAVPIWEDPLALSYMILFFFLMIGLGASIRWDVFLAKIKQPKGIIIGAVSQFVCLPLLAFGMAMAFRDELDVWQAIGLIVLCSCPGGAFSNILAFIVNADLVLSVAMTTSSNILAIGFLPLNTYIYTLPFVEESGGEVVLEMAGILISAICVLLGTMLGICLNNKWPQLKRFTEPFGLVCGLALIIIALVQNSLSTAPIWKQPGIVYGLTYLMTTAGLLVGIGLGLIFRLPKPSIVAIALETSVQNKAIAISVLSLTIRDPQIRAEAIAVPIIYGLFSLAQNMIFTLVAWKCGWTLADKHDTCCEIWRSYKARDLDEELELHSRENSPEMVPESPPRSSPRGESQENDPTITTKESEFLAKQRQTTPESETALEIDYLNDDNSKETKKRSAVGIDWQANVG